MQALSRHSKLSISLAYALGARGGRITVMPANPVIGPDEATRRADVAPDEYVQVAVADIGMPQEVAARAFEPYLHNEEARGGAKRMMRMITALVGCFCRAASGAVAADVGNAEQGRRVAER
jgi:hypothetical protein